MHTRLSTIHSRPTLPFLASLVMLAALPLSVATAQPAVQPSRLIPQATFAPPQPAAECPVAAAATIADIPDDVDLVLVIENGTDIRSSPIGDATAGFLAEAGIVADLTKAWSALGTQLGWSSQETFDRLLGRRVVLLSKSVAPVNDRRWTILSDVSVETETRLKERLQAAPRAIVQGHQILTIENGAYELTSHHHDAAASGKAARRPAASDRVTLVLGPTGKGDLFDDTLARLSRKTSPPNAMVAANNGAVGTLSAHEIFTLACQAGPTEVLLMAALDPAPDAAAPGAPERWKDFVMLAGHREQDAGAGAIGKADGGAWRSRVIVRQTSKRDELLKIAPTSDAPFRALAAGSLLAMVQNAPLSAVLGEWAPAFTNVFSMLPIPEDAKSQMTARQAISVRALPPDNRVSCTVARQTESTEMLARTLDPAISANIARIEQQFGVVAPPPQNYAGIAPNAVRTTALASSEQGGGGAMSVFSARPLTVSWAYPSQAAVNGPANLADACVKDAACAAPRGGGGEKRPGWWVLNLAQTSSVVEAAAPGEILRSDANALLTIDPNVPSARWVWLASARPAALEALLPSIFPDYNGLRSGLRRFEALAIALQITEQGDVQGDLSLRLARQK